MPRGHKNPTRRRRAAAPPKPRLRHSKSAAPTAAKAVTSVVRGRSVMTLPKSRWALVKSEALKIGLILAACAVCNKLEDVVAEVVAVRTDADRVDFYASSGGLTSEGEGVVS